MTENICSINFFVNLIKIKRISKAIIKTQAEIGSICLAPLSSLKYFAVWQPFILQSSWFFSIILIHLIKSLPKPQCSKAVIRKLWFKESKLFLKTIAILVIVPNPKFQLCQLWTFHFCLKTCHWNMQSDKNQIKMKELFQSCG